MSAGDFAAVAVALYAAHHVGDYWVQTDHQAQHKGLPGREGRRACLLHVLTYLATQSALLIPIGLMGVRLSWFGTTAALTVSGVTHYLADRRERGPMFWLARRLPGKARFLTLGVPRANLRTGVFTDEDEWDAPLDNPSLGTGAWALDQSWHIFWGVFVASLLLSML